MLETNTLSTADFATGPDRSDIASCVSLCESADPQAAPSHVLDLLAATCWEAGFPACGRLYAGSYACENYFLALTDAFHDSVRRVCADYGMGATLVVPIIGQAFLARAEERLADVLERFGDVYDEVVVNDIAQFLHVGELGSARIGLGRLFSREPRDARYPDLMGRTAHPALSAEALECLAAAPPATRPLVEVDPVSAVVDVSCILEAAPSAEVAIHLPLCLATVGRNCGPASTFEPPSEKFRLGRGCGRHCLRMAQGALTDEGARYVKHGRAYYFANPAVAIAGAASWRVVYAATHETMR